jgi:hypothetical protein
MNEMLMIKSLVFQFFAVFIFSGCTTLDIRTYVVPRNNVITDVNIEVNNRSNDTILLPEELVMTPSSIVGSTLKITFGSPDQNKIWLL